MLQPTLKRLGLQIDPAKRDALEAADQQGNAFMSLFTTFGSFSIFAGFLLIFLIFVMLAAERRGELGIARAIGTRRGHLIQMYVYEGLAYDLLAAAVGAAIGVAVAFGMVFVLSSALGAEGITIEHDVQLQSVVVAYTVGVLLDLRRRRRFGLASQPAEHRDRDPQPARATRPQAAEASLDRRPRCDDARRAAHSPRREHCAGRRSSSSASRCS